MKSPCLSALFLLFVGAYGLKARFDNYQVYRLTPEDEDQMEALQELELTGEYDFWTLSGAPNRTSDILIPPHKRADFQEFVDATQIPGYCLIENIQSLIDEEEGKPQSRCRDMSWTSYHKLSEIYSWLDEVAKTYANAKKIYAGKSYQGRRITGLEISFGENNTGVFIESGIHGREWITPAATSWMVKQILDSPADSVFRNFTYFYFPVFNPDGYAYSWTHNRLWKKTRTPYKVGKLTCYGADPNKNWNFRWNDIKGCSNPCSESYAGPFAFSEIEMKSIAGYLKCIARSRNIDIYLAYRSYSQLLLYPWDSQPSPAPLRELWQSIGEAAAEELTSIHGTEIEVGNTCEFFYPSSGGSREWYYGQFKPTISFLYQLRDRGNRAFFLPPDQIIPSGEELLPSLERILLEYQELNITNPELIS